MPINRLSLSLMVANLALASMLSVEYPLLSAYLPIQALAYLLLVRRAEGWVGKAGEFLASSLLVALAALTPVQSNPVDLAITVTSLSTGLLASALAELRDIPARWVRRASYSLSLVLATELILVAAGAPASTLSTPFPLALLVVFAAIIVLLQLSQ